MSSVTPSRLHLSRKEWARGPALAPLPASERRRRLGLRQHVATAPRANPWARHPASGARMRQQRCLGPPLCARRYPSNRAARRDSREKSRRLAPTMAATHSQGAASGAAARRRTLQTAEMTAAVAVAVGPTEAAAGRKASTATARQGHREAVLLPLSGQKGGDGCQRAAATATQNSRDRHSDRPPAG